MEDLMFISVGQSFNEDRWQKNQLVLGTAHRTRSITLQRLFHLRLKHLGLWLFGVHSGKEEGMV